MMNGIQRGKERDLQGTSTGHERKPSGNDRRKMFRGNDGETGGKRTDWQIVGYAGRPPAQGAVGNQGKLDKIEGELKLETKRTGTWHAGHQGKTSGHDRLGTETKRPSSS